MKYYELNKEEKAILDDIEKGIYVPAKNFKKLKRFYEEVARNTLNKTKNVNIRLAERTLMKIKTKAAEEGIPYQTLVSSVLHKFVNQ